MNLKITQLRNQSRKFHLRNKDSIKDIILFGSERRGKHVPKDIDILILFRDRVDKELEYDYRKIIQKSISSVSVISKTEKGLVDPSFDAREGILFEGTSLIDSQQISSRYGFSSQGMFIYQTGNLNNSLKTRFYYAMNGRRGQDGLIKRVDGIRLSDNILFVSLENIEKVKEFFDFWKIEYRYVPILIPSRLARKEIIGKVI